MRVGTGRMTHLCVPNSELIEGVDFTQSERVHQLIENPSNYCAVVYPGRDAFDLSCASVSEIRNWLPSGKTLVVFVVDGTWSSAKKMLRRSGNLLQLPQICFTPARRSEYRIRRQPQAHCVSTIEAVYQILGIFEPMVERENLLEVFRGMVELQTKFNPKRRS